MSKAPLSVARSETPLESKSVSFTKASSANFQPRGQSRLTSSAGNMPARAKPDAANRGEPVSARAYSRYRPAMLKAKFQTNFVAAKLVQSKNLASPIPAVVPRSTLLPNPSLKRSANGRPPGPVWRYAAHFRQPGPGVPPSPPA